MKEFIKKIHIDIKKTGMYIRCKSYICKSKNKVANFLDKKPLKFEKNSFIIWWYGFLTVILTGWIGDILLDKIITLMDPTLVSSTSISNLLLFIVLFVVVLSFYWRLYLIGKIIFAPVREIRILKNPTQSKVLICNVTKLSPKPKLTIQDKRWVINLKNKDGDKEKRVIFTENIDEDVQKLTALEKEYYRWNGTQLLRAIKGHKESLEKLYLVSSDDLIIKGEEKDSGTYEFVDDLEEILNNYFKNNNVEIIDYKKRSHPTEIEKTYELYNEIIDNLVQTEEYKGEDIAIDITGGKVIMSVAGAFSTLHHDKVVFQYVDTIGDKQVTQFDFELQAKGRNCQL